MAVVFPGQGTQRPAMGSPWRDHPAWEVVEALEAATAEPVSDLLLDAPAQRLSRTREAQLAVFANSLMVWEAVRLTLPEITVFAGHSLGQLTALVAAGAVSLEDGARLALARADSTQAVADAVPGRMAALLGADLPTASAACAAARDACWIANDNAPGQVVVGGTRDGVDEAIGRARDLGVRKVVPLDVGGAFHTPLMSPARDALAPVLRVTPFREPVAPVVHNADAEAHRDAGWAPRLAEHLVSTVRWRESIETLTTFGIEAVVEVGHGGMLSGLVRRTVPGLGTHSVATPDELPIGVGR